MINRDALFSDETEDYRNPVEPPCNSMVTVGFRTAAGNVDEVYWINSETSERCPMFKVRSGSTFDYYEISLQAGNRPLPYHFEIRAAEECCHYNKLGVTEELDRKYAFRILPGMSTPGWARGAVFYQIFTDRFYNGDASNDVVDREYIYVDGEGTEQVKDWNRNPTPMDVRSFYGGDLQGVLDKMDYLKYLGVDVLYFNPLFVSPSNHKYDTQDYDYIDPHYGVIVEDGGAPVPERERDNCHAGKYSIRVSSKENLEASNALFAKLVEEAHKRGIRVIIDGVFNHCGSFNKWMDKELLYKDKEGYAPGAYLSAESPYREFFHFQGGEWPYNNHYDGWWNFDTLPKLNYETKALYDYILGIGKKWVSAPYAADGWRLDVAADLGCHQEMNHRFWKDFRKAVREANPEALILAEHYGDPTDWLQGDEWDTVMNYDAFMEPVSFFLTGMEKHSDSYHDYAYNNADMFFDTMWRNMSCFTLGSLQTAMNELSNHDHSRFLTRTNRKIGRLDTMGSAEAERDVRQAVLREAVLIQMTWPGAPAIYYGDEAGLCGWTDPDNRRTFPWGREDLELIEFHRYMISIHKKNKALTHGSIKELYREYGVICYGRFCQENRLVIAVNNTDAEKWLALPVWQMDIHDNTVMERIMLTNDNGYNIGRIDLSVRGGQVMVCLEPVSAIVLREKN